MSATLACLAFLSPFLLVAAWLYRRAVREEQAERAAAPTVEIPVVNQLIRPADPGRPTRPRPRRARKAPAHLTRDEVLTFDAIVHDNPDLAAVDVLALSRFYIVPEESS